MADISPFRGIHYASHLADALPDLISPPYDVVTHDERLARLARHADCIVHVILPVDHGDVGTADDYARSAGELWRLLASGALVEDSEPAYYVYRQTFSVPGSDRRMARTGLFCALRLTPYADGAVLPHEATRAKAKQDRLELMRATQTNTEPIYCLYEDPEGSAASLLDAVCEAKPLLSAGVDGDTHDVWRVDDRASIAAITAAIPGRVWIADGHHRYETALAYAAESGLPEAARMMVVLSAFEDAGLVVLPTHRLVRGASEQALAQSLQGSFDVQAMGRLELTERLAEPASDHSIGFGLLGRAASYWIGQRAGDVGTIYDTGQSPAWNLLDVSVLHRAVIEAHLGIGLSDLGTTDRIGYVREVEDAATGVDSGGWDLALLLRGVRPGQLRDVAAVGGKMPPKSTYFYPKLWSGLLLRALSR
ncbi:MAG: DUF1015 domain-containing protein [Armatimonadetes bacterium]|nr:DUF1015 domain-containing protein [Armatimonadota bacterium]